MKNKKTLEEHVQDLEDRIKLLEQKPVSTPETSATVPSPEKTKAVSEKEYLLDKKPTDDVQRTFYLGSYLEVHKKLESFTVDDLREAFRAAREPLPSNINDKINKNISKGYFMESTSKDGKKAWILTSTGERVVNSEESKN